MTYPEINGKSQGVDPTAQKLVDINVDRLDGVDDGASNRRWLIVKSDNAPMETKMDMAQLEKSALALMQALAGSELAPEAAEALNGMSQALGMAAPAAPVVKAEDPKPGYPVVKAEDPPVPPKDDEPVAKAVDAASAPVGAPEPDDEEALKTSVASLTESVKSMQGTIDAFVAKSTAAPATPMLTPVTTPPSTQDGGTERVEKKTRKKLGEGIFTSASCFRK